LRSRGPNKADGKQKSKIWSFLLQKRPNYGVRRNQRGGGECFLVGKKGIGTTRAH